jgi:hypothetical protein
MKNQPCHGMIENLESVGVVMDSSLLSVQYHPQQVMISEGFVINHVTLTNTV